MQTRYYINTTQVTPSLHLLMSLCGPHCILITGNIRCRDGYTCTCSLCITCFACTPPSLHLVSVVFGTTIPTFWKFLHLFVFNQISDFLTAIQQGQIQSFKRGGAECATSCTRSARKMRNVQKLTVS